MRKLLLLTVGLAMVACLTTPVVQGQMVVVGDTSCTNTSNYLPWNAYYGYSESQYIIPATEMLAAGLVPTDTFYRMGWWQCSGTFSGATNVVDVYLQEVADPYPQVCTSPLYPNGTLVFSGPLNSVITPGEVTFDLSTTYVWGGQNLVVTVCELQPSYSSTTYWSVNLDAGNGINRYSDTVLYDCNLTTSETTANCRGAWATTLFDNTGAPTPTPTPITACVTTVSSFPYNETFETATFGAWLQATWDQMNWTLDQGGTSSAGTGPSVDHTTGTATGWYAYLETSSGSTGDTAILYGVCFDTSTLVAPELSFWYHMYGATMGTLDVEMTLDGGGSWTNIWSLSGDQGDLWYGAVINLSAYAGSTIGIRFIGIRGTSFTGDMAIDDIGFGESSGSTPTPTNTPIPGPGQACNDPFVVDLTGWTPGSAATYTDTGTTVGSGNHYTDYTCATGLTSEEIVYSFTPPVDLDLVVDLCGSAYDTIMVVTDGCPVSVSECYYNDDYCGTQSGIACQTYQAGVTYYVFVEGYGGGSGAYTLNVTECWAPPDPLLQCDPTSIFSQPFDGATVFTTSDENGGYISADDFSGLTDTIGGLTWWGAELICCWSACTRTVLDFNVIFYSDNAGLPGTVVHQEVVTAARTATTALPFGSATYGFVQRYDATLAAPVSIASGWVAVEALDDAGSTCWFMWGDGGLSSGTSDYAQYDGATSTWALSGYGADLAFCFLPGGAVPTATPTTEPPTATPTTEPPTATPTGPTPTPPPQQVPATGPMGLGLLLLAIGGLMSLAGIRRK
ncbi:hypothetical protein JXA80_07405 [bacterium]|nr:hypothetical protein [candidate division CSSED10-310 bacterium]